VPRARGDMGQAWVFQNALRFLRRNRSFGQGRNLQSLGLRQARDAVGETAACDSEPLVATEWSLTKRSGK
jgi:hypothetical protein